MPLLLWLTAVALPPLVVGALGAAGLETERLRLAGLVGAAVMLAACAGLLAAAGGAWTLPWPLPLPGVFGAAALRLNTLSAALLPLPAGLWLLTLAVTPHARLDRAGIPRTALATLFTTAAFLTESPALLLACWAASAALFLAGFTAPEQRRTWRVAALYQGASTLALALGIGLAGLEGSKQIGLAFITLAVLIRKGIFPFHAWIPQSFDRGRIGPTLLYSAPQLGAYVGVVLVLPEASAGLLRIAVGLALVTAVYGAALALVQADARRACGYLFVSQSALVLAGLDSGSENALAGSLILWLSSAVAFTGMARTVLVLEARRGRLDLRRHHGGYEQMPLLATSFLVLGLACTGFPGTLGFIGEEMLLEGAVAGFPVLGFSIVVTSALTGLAVLRMYFSLFTGAKVSAPELRLLPREARVFAAVAAALVLGGLAGQPLVANRLKASQEMLEARSAMGDGHPGRPGVGGAALEVD